MLHGKCVGCFYSSIGVTKNKKANASSFFLRKIYENEKTNKHEKEGTI
jgi:hypothetical protein